MNIFKFLNEIFIFIDSVSYSSLKHKDTINNLRTPSFVKIQKLVRRLVSGLTDIEKHAMYSILLPRIPIFNNLIILYLYIMDSETIKVALRAEKAMNQALKNEKSSKKQKNQKTIPKVNPIAEKV